jgi:DNA-binding response OmpR family regulator
MEQPKMVKRKVLLIDDDADFGRLLTGFLVSKNFEVIVAHTLGEGMAAMEKERPEHIFLDNGLPDGLGWGKAIYIRAQYPMAQLNLISAWVREAPVSNIRILQKPIKIDDLMACLQQSAA